MPSAWNSTAAAIAGVLCFAAPATAASSQASAPQNTPVTELKPGQWIWNPDAKGMTPSHIVVDISRQLAVVYGDDVRIGVTTVSTGRKGHRTPTGVFPITEKDRDHRSNIYSNAPMPYMMRLTSYGIALHAGHLPGYPASHGCIRMPLAFARNLFEITPRGTRVTVTARSAALAVREDADADADEPEAVTPVQIIVTDPSSENAGGYDARGAEPPQNP